MSLKGKIAIVTGGTGALGSVIADRFAAEGVRLTISYRQDQELNQFPESMKVQVSMVKADVTVEKDVVRLFDSVEQVHGNIQIVVNTVGGFLPRKPLVDINVEEWQRMMDINLLSTFLCNREALRRMKGKPYGRIINFSAMAGLNPSAGRAAYSVSKAGVSLLTEIAAMEMKGTGITINAIAPSIIDTRANRESMPDDDFSKWVKPEDIAEMICFLCSDSAAPVSGNTFKMYGGV
jgi:NAD(P)-dependent dehydrogenase (short-subunit alcohol dehydrogenase family)